MQLDLTIKADNVLLDKGIENTKRIIEALKLKAKEFNVFGQEKVYLYQLKSVFIKGASKKEEGKTLKECGFARVNMYLRKLAKPYEVPKEIHGVTDISVFNKRFSLDFSGYFNPNELDFAQAAEDVKKFNLISDFDSVNELYLDESKQPFLIKEYL